jgi:hypothetical protein
MTTLKGEPAGGQEIPDTGNTDLPRVWSPDPYPVVLGLCILTSIYLLPVFPVPAPATQFLTLADIVANGSSGSYSWNPMLHLTFWLGWGVSLGLVIYGLVSKKPGFSFKKT